MEPEAREQRGNGRRVPASHERCLSTVLMNWTIGCVLVRQRDEDPRPQKWTGRKRIPRCQPTRGSQRAGGTGDYVMIATCRPHSSS